MSVLFAFLAHAAQGEITLKPMTPALGGSSVCLLQTPFSREQDTKEKSPCGNGKKCFESAAASVHKGDVLLLPGIPAVAMDFQHPVLAQSRDAFTVHFPQNNRPPGHRLLAFSVVQRE